MKNFILALSMALLSGLQVTAQSTSNNSSFEIFSEDGYEFSVLVNGIQQNPTPKANVKVKSLISNRYTVKVKFKDSKLADLQKAIGLRPDIHLTMKIKTNRKGKLKISYVSEVPVAQAPVSANEVTYTTVPVVTETITENTTVTTPGVTTTTTTSTTVANSPNENISVNVDIGGIKMNTSVNMTGIEEQVTTQTTTTSSTTTSTSNNTQVAVVNCDVNAGDFAGIKTAVEDEISDQDILTMAKQATNKKCLSTQQIIELGDIIISEQVRYSWAEYAYELATDKGNWYKVGSTLFINQALKEKCGALNN